MKNGSILPIGYFVCGSCKDKHMKGIDMSLSHILTPDMPNIQAMINATTNNSTRNTLSVRPSVVAPLKRPGWYFI